MSHYILVHGAWEAAWTWDETRLVLEKHGHTVTAVNLPGTAENAHEITQVTLDSYVQTVTEVIAPLDHKVILVGHSMAGVIISQVAEALPDRIEKLVFAAAFLLESGNSVIAAMQCDPQGEFFPEIVFSADQTSATVTPQTWRDKAFHDVGEAKIAQTLSRVNRPQATQPFMAPVTLSAEKFGSVPKVYIRTTEDKIVSPELQDQMLGNWDVEQVHDLSSGHFPTLSMPGKLAELLF